MCNNYFKTLPHTDVAEIFPEVYSVQGTMKLFKVFQYSRNMTILKNEDSLILVNPVRLDQQTEKKLLKMGNIEHILKIGALHSVDIPYFMDKFSPKLWTLKDDHTLPDYKTDFILNDHPTLPFMDIKVHVFEGSKVAESILILPSNGGVVLSCDSLVNMTPHDMHANKLTAFLAKMIPSPTYIGPNWVKFAKPSKKSFMDILDFDFEHMVLAHGDPVLGGAKELLREYFSGYKKWRV